MTIEEKADRIGAYCKNKDNCVKCPLKYGDENTCYED